MERKGNPCALLVGMQIGAATMERGRSYLRNLKVEPWLAQILSVGCEPKGHWFDFQSGHMPGLSAMSPVGGA